MTNVANSSSETTKTSFLAVIESSDDWNAATSVRKIRLNLQLAPPKSTTVVTRENVLAHYSPTSSNNNNNNNNKDDGCTVQVYDCHQQDYVTIDSNMDILSRFGTRVRIRIIRNPPHPLDHQPPLLALPGRYYATDVVKDRIRVAGKSLFIQQEINQTLTGHSIWDGAILLTRYLERHPDRVADKRVLELGAGVGLVGIAAGVLGAKSVIMTDLAYCLPLMQRNIANNRHWFSDQARIDGCECDWFQPPSQHLFQAHTDLILVADCVWMEELVVPLFSTLEALAGSCDAEILMTYQQRGKRTHEALLRELKRFTMESVQDDTFEIPALLQILSIRPKRVNFSTAASIDRY